MESMTEGTSDDSDGLDDTEFQEEHEKYLEDSENRTIQILKLEDERLTVREILILFQIKKC